MNKYQRIDLGQSNYGVKRVEGKDTRGVQNVEMAEFSNQLSVNGRSLQKWLRRNGSKCGRRPERAQCQSQRKKKFQEGCNKSN